MGLLEGYLMGASPAYRNRKAAEAQAQARAQDNELLTNLLGVKGTEAQNLAPDAFNMEEAAVMDQLGEGEGVYQAEQQGSGLRGGGMDTREMAIRLMQMQSGDNRKTGQSMLLDQLKYRDPAQEQKGHGLTNITRGNEGFAWGINPMGVQVRLEGGQVPQTPQRELVNVQVGGDGRPKAPLGMQTVVDPETGGWMQTAVKGGKFDPAGTENTLTESNSYAKDFKIIDRAKTGLDVLRTAVDDEGLSFVPGKSAQRLESAATNVMMSLKEYYNLGVLSGEDKILLEKIIGDPTSFKSNVIGANAYTANIDRAKYLMNKAETALNTQFPNSRQSKKATKAKKARIKQLKAEIARRGR